MVKVKMVRFGDKVRAQRELGLQQLDSVSALQV